MAKAVEYLGRAGQQALQRSAYTDAISSLGAAIDLLQRLPDGSERIQREVFLQLAVGRALSHVKGFAAPEVERAYNRARELCEREGETPELFPALSGVWAVHLLRGALRTAYQLAEQLLRRAQSARDPAGSMAGHVALGHTSYQMGGFLSAREHFENAISLYDPERHRSLIFRYGGADASVNCMSGVAWVLWQSGYPDQALKRGNEALALAQVLSHPYSLAFAGVFVSVLHQIRREPRVAQETGEMMGSRCAVHGFTRVLPYA